MPTPMTLNSTSSVTRSDDSCSYTRGVHYWMKMNRLKLNADKTELLWAGSKYGSALLGSSGPSLQLVAETIKASDSCAFARSHHSFGPQPR